MKKLLWFVAGALAGFAVARVLDHDPRSSEVLDEIDARIAEFTDRIGDAYRDQEAALSGLVDDAKAAVQDVANSAAQSVTDASKK